MTFEELKFEIIDRQRKKEINKLFHLYVKAETYEDILNIVKSESNIRWILKNGFYDLIFEFPTEVLENAGIYNREITIIDSANDIILLSAATLNLTQSGKNRCKITSLGGRSNIQTQQMSMVEIETFDRSFVNVNSNDYSYTYITARDNSTIEFSGNDKSTCMLHGYDNSNTTLNIANQSYCNYKLNDDAKINFGEYVKKTV